MLRMWKAFFHQYQDQIHGHYRSGPAQLGERCHCKLFKTTLINLRYSLAKTAVKGIQEYAPFNADLWTNVPGETRLIQMLYE